jgi:predicted nucleotidyltransferase
VVQINDIQELANRIAREFEPDRIILFGSYARGTAAADSDVDLLVILPFEGKGFWKSVEIINRVNVPFSLDLMAYRPEAAARRYAQGDPLIRDAMDHGRVLYERGESADRKEAAITLDICTRMRERLRGLS